ncbi:ABC transporter permease subunit [Bacillus luteolus]|uniref:ABC transporter permease subunit n=1 Tax=Litchfieldia luteola TaxID=682179 RepID=A0ABR9QQB2_9BACI|nr:ABC transporter permease subunit [Cytobacillus luteolus]MBE4910662.1 ABC transporter permease subunit [Cytobacillus luteolus]MBP1943841.1 ABC-2 type transport system permease protein [Cytobacillus luteolus]
MNLFVRELKAHRKSLIIWSIGMVLLIVSGVGKYSGFSASDQSMNELMSQMPKSLQAIMGSNSFDLSTIMGYYGLLFLYIVLMAVIHSSMLGATIIAKEERDKTAEFLFVKPLSRNKIISSKLCATLVNVVVLNIITFISSLLIVQQNADGAAVFKDIALLMMGLFMLQILFMSIGTALAALKKNSKKAASIATAILLAAFILSIAIDMKESLEPLRFLTPFKYFEAKQILSGGGYETIYFILSFVLIFILIALTFTSYKKRDLN